MPDHIHFVVEGVSTTADLQSLAKDFKQRTGFAYKRQTGQPLWQEGFYDRVLRQDENLEETVRYLLGNPVRAGLVRHPIEWPYVMSERFDLRELLEGVERVESWT
jgi:putative transposase